MSFLVVLPPVLGQLWCLSWWFWLLSWHNSDRCGIFWLGWLMDVGRYEGVAPSMWAFPAWFWRMSGSCAIYVPKNDIFFAIFYALAIATLLGPGTRTPPSSPKKSFFLSFPKETWHLVGSVFRGEPKWKIGTALVFPHFLNNSGVWMGFKGHRWRNSVLG